MDNGDTQSDRPSPDDLVSFLPWACNQLQLDTRVVVCKVSQNEYVSAALTDRSKKSKSRPRIPQSRADIHSDQDKDERNSNTFFAAVDNYEKTVKITAVYDNCYNLVAIKFDKNKNIPRLVLKILGLIVQFYTYLTNFTIDGGMDMYTLYEVRKFLNTSHITDVCLDDSPLAGGNYHVLLESECSIRSLSLCRCKIDDSIVEKIASKLDHTNTASKSLLTLNLTSNKFTDIGAKHLAIILRSNRHLYYLNLSDNNITDDGAAAILSCLIEFPLSSGELYEAKNRHMTYLKTKNEVIERILKELRAGDIDKRSFKRKSVRPGLSPLAKRNKLEKETSLKSVADANLKSLVTMDTLLFDKAMTMAENVLGEFRDPFTTSDTILKEGIVYCKGNNVLCYLNLSYNHLSHLSLKIILNVLVGQKLLDRKPRGLINILVEGNNIPVSCMELTQIDDLLDSGMMAQNRRLSAMKKRPNLRSLK